MSIINSLSIKGFKSVKSLDIDCRRINLFIGEPNSGKSNILEALGLLSFFGHGGDIHDYIRFDTSYNLFNDGIVDNPEWSIKCTGKLDINLTALYRDGRYHFSNHGQKCHILDDIGKSSSVTLQNEMKKIRFYRIKSFNNLNSPELANGLLPPDGKNLVAQIYTSKDLRQMVADFFEPSGWNIAINPHERKIEIQKQEDGVVITFPFFLASDTLLRMTFYNVAIESNKDSVIVFEEPEAHAFPYYTKHLGERIALDNSNNQYFIATHNPYLFSAIREKSNAEDLAVFATYYRDFQTRVKPLSQDDLDWLFSADPLLGVSHLTEEEK